MKTLVVGDSFVTNKIETYADHLCKIQSDIVVKGLPGSGNDLISHVLLNEYKNYDRFIINWTSTCRYDLLISDDIKQHLKVGIWIITKLFVIYTDLAIPRG